MRKRSVAGVALLVMSGFLGAAYGAGINAHIPFQFTASGKSMPAGAYQGDLMEGGGAVQLINTRTGDSVVLPIVTTVAEQPGGQSCSAATGAGISADIPFQFTAGGKSMPAGEYEGDLRQDGGAIRLINTKTGDSVVLMVQTAIAAQPGSASCLVFDTLGDDHYLSELHLEGQEGYMFKGVSVPHTHTTLRASR